MSLTGYLRFRGGGKRFWVKALGMGFGMQRWGQGLWAWGGCGEWGQNVKVLELKVFGVEGGYVGTWDCIGVIILGYWK